MTDKKTYSDLLIEAFVADGASSLEDHEAVLCRAIINERERKQKAMQARATAEREMQQSELKRNHSIESIIAATSAEAALTSALNACEKKE